MNGQIQAIIVALQSANSYHVHTIVEMNHIVETGFFYMALLSKKHDVIDLPQ